MGQSLQQPRWVPAGEVHKQQRDQTTLCVLRDGGPLAGPDAVILQDGCVCTKLLLVTGLQLTLH